MIRNHLAVPIHEEFSKIPGDLTHFTSLVVVERGVAAEESENVMSVVTININLVEHRVLGTVFFTSEILNPGIIVGFLVGELVAWECKNLKSVFTILSVEVSHPSIVRGSKSSEAGNICHKCYFFAS